jgi:hypothetical protein
MSRRRHLFEHGGDHDLLLWRGDSFVNMAPNDLPGDGPQAWTMTVTQGEIPLGSGVGRLAPIADSVRIAVPSVRMGTEDISANSGCAEHV